MKLLKRVPIKYWIWAALIIALLLYVTLRLDISTLDRGAATAVAQANVGAVKVEKGLAELPNEADFKTVAQSGELELKLDAKTGHFNVLDKRNGNIWRSYPDPERWSKETQEGIWRTHLRSPVMLRYIDLTGKVTQPKETNLLEEQGKIIDVASIDGGFKLTFDMPSKQFTIPIEVKVEKDSIVTRIIDSGIKEGSLSLIWIRLYPFLGADHSYGQEGYLFIPDGSGALIPYREHNTNVNRIYQEPVYGTDVSFKANDDPQSRNPIMMPVFGAKSGDKGFLTIIEDGAEMTDVVASPSGVFSGYNWITAQQNYRSTYKQVTNEQKNRFFITYNKKERFTGDRSVRYVMLDKPKANYVGMGERYRQYLMDAHKMQPLKPKNSTKLPMSVSLVGAERENGLITDRYLKATTTADAMKIVQRLYGLGVDNMTVNYMGWAKGGYSDYGAPLPVDSRLGGDKGMKQFIDFAHTLDIPVYLDTNYMFNNTNAGSYNKRQNGLRDLGGTVLKSIVSLGHIEKVLTKDISYYNELGADGITLGTVGFSPVEGLGRSVNSDYNTNYPLSREESRKKQQELLQKVKDADLDIRGNRSSIFAVPYMSTVESLIDDYSYDSFSETSIPFIQIALHGLVNYTSSFINERDEYQKQFLRDLEYGSAPSFVFIYENAEDFKNANELHLYSPDFRSWETQAVQEYQRLNEALGDVQNKFIVNHRQLAPEVKETTYQGGKRIIVNYGPTTYSSGGITVKPLDYLIVKGGTAP
ncbi:hypothetical protein FE784_13490 [Paenibacillus hemerocallicola]|jgi:hypothetical protein|uniref:Glycosyl hydrolase family 13 catalytic domain-containing protein n=1 Tax=Paenibacillus hemerocallicola TaxID=1172614 RepID=A0A5C4TB29_9BACL|nr:DUF5696 domain-containing protein [Paenibacillus hemerocallicola]TNJ65667.1 hypothetical protein FE784_13490 [Paenibacillus hemerocallicola]